VNIFFRKMPPRFVKIFLEELLVVQNIIYVSDDNAMSGWPKPGILNNV